MVRIALARRRCSGAVSDDAVAARVEVGAPQDLVDEEVAEPGDVALLQERGLDRGVAPAEPLPQRRRGDVERVDAQPGLVRVEQHGAEPSRVAHHERAAVAEADAEPVPVAVVAVARVAQRVARRVAVQQHAAGHAEVQPECRARVLGPGVSVRAVSGLVSSRRSLPWRRAATKRRPGSTAVITVA